MHRVLPLLCLLLLAAGAGAEAADSTPAVHESHLQAMDWMTRGTWTSEFTTPDGKPFVIESEMRWALTGTAIYYNTRFNHQPHYFGMYAFDPAAGKIKFVDTDNEGDFSSGTADASQSGLTQDFNYSTAAGTKHYTCEIRRVSEDEYDFKVFLEGTGKPVVALHYVRK